MITEEQANQAKSIVSSWDDETQAAFKEKYAVLKDDSQRESVLNKVITQYGNSETLDSSSPKVNLSEDEINIKDPFPYLNWIPGGKDLNKALVDTATKMRDENPAAFHLMNMEEQTKAGVAEGITAGIPRAIIEKLTGYEISKGNLAGRIVGSILPIGYVSKSVTAPKIVKNALEGAIASNIVEGIPADEFFDIKNRVKLSAEGAAAGVIVPAAMEGGVSLAKKILSVGDSFAKNSVKVIGQLLNATHVSDYAYGKNPPQAVIDALGKDLPSGSFQELQMKIQKAIPEYIDKAKKIVRENQGEKLINLSEELNNIIDKDINKLVEGGANNQAAVTRLQNIKDAINFKPVLDSNGRIVKGTEARILDGITPEDAVSLKQEIGKWSKWTGNASDDKVVNMATKKLYGYVNSEVTKAVPESAKINETVSGLLSADNLLNRKVAYEQGAPVFKGTGKIVGMAGVLYGLASGNPTLVKESIGVLGISKLSQSVEARTKLAYGLSKMGRLQQIDFFVRYPELKKIVDPIMSKFDKSTIDAVKIINARAQTAASRYSAPLIKNRIIEANNE